jgi:hypothetical protein
MESFINQAWYLFIKDAAAFLFTVAGLIIAGMGLATWKEQLKGTKEFDAAYELNYSILKLRDAIRHVRYPLISHSESYQAIQYSKEKHPEKSDEDIKKDSHASVYEMRWEEIVKAITEMESHLLAAEVLWGTEILSLIKPLNLKITELNIALRQHFQPELRTKNSEDLFNIIYGSGDGSESNDVFSQKINEAIRRIADYLKTKMS